MKKKTIILIVAVACFAIAGWLVYRGITNYFRNDKILSSRATKESRIVEIQIYKNAWIGTSLFATNRTTIMTAVKVNPQPYAIQVNGNMLGVDQAPTFTGMFQVGDLQMFKNTEGKEKWHFEAFEGSKEIFVKIDDDAPHDSMTIELIAIYHDERTQ